MSVGFTEVLLIVIVVLLLFGAKRIPEIAKAIGRASVEYKKAKNALQQEGKELLKDAEKAAEAESDRRET
ncbi:MAG: Sec-independent protein translocase subunit TatA/TatB [Kiritimatiellia bacterium]|jgi:sec-independent protein translocase protein TatA